MGRWDNPGEPARPGSEPPPVPGSADEPSPAPGGAFFALPAAAATTPDAAAPDGAAPRPARRGRGRWVALVALVVLVGLAGGLLIWAPWQSPPLLRPTGLTAGPATASSVAFHWSDPATGPLPDKYVILYGGAVIGSVPGKVTSYTRTGLYPDTSYAYRVAAVRGGRRSAPSAVLVLKTATPPLSAARWEGPWTVHVKVVRGGAALTGPRPLRWDESWQVSPRCAAGPCAVRVHGTFNGYPFRATLAKAGTTYRGTTVANSFRCGPRHGGSLPMRTTLKIRVTIAAAQGGSNGAWTATSLGGTLIASAAYTTSATYYCNAFQVTAALSGNQ